MAKVAGAVQVGAREAAGSGKDGVGSGDTEEARGSLLSHGRWSPGDLVGEQELLADNMSQGNPASGSPSNPLTPQQLILVLTEFRNRFGQDPMSVHVGGSYPEGAATTSSDIDVLIETNMAIPRFGQQWFDYLKAINPGAVPPNVTGVGTGVGEALIGNDPGDIPKAGLLDPFFKRPGTITPPTIKVF